MGTRELDPRLKELYDSGTPVYSISRLGTINGCLYEAYKTYVLHEKGAQNIYGAAGTKIHDVLEQIVNGEATEDDLLPAMESELADMDMLGIHFPKDFKGGDTIREGWVKDMTHFCNTYHSPRENLTTEQLFIYKTPKGRYLQGYIDLFHTNKDGSIDIYDYKTSSMYTGSESLKEHGYQLVTYLLGKEQEGFNVRRVAWIFLKYVDITFMGYKTSKSKKKTEITKTIERKKIATELEKHVVTDLKETGYDDFDINDILSKFRESNMFEDLPEEIRCNYVMKPCVYFYEVNEKVKQDCIDYIDGTIDAWEQMDMDDESIFKPREFTKTTKTGKKSEDTFYCVNLCGHFKTCPYIHDYLDQKNAQKEEQDEFADLFS